VNAFVFYSVFRSGEVKAKQLNAAAGRFHFDEKLLLFVENANGSASKDSQ